jgi:hypothetical protein
MPRIVQSIGLTPEASAAVAQTIPDTTGGPLEIINVGSDTLTLFIEREREMIVTPWVFLKKDTSRPNKTLFCYQRPLTVNTTASDVRAMLEEFHNVGS